MYFESRRNLKYIKINPLIVILFIAVSGPIYFLYLGVFEWALLYVLAFYMLDVPYHLIAHDVPYHLIAHIVITFVSPLLILLSIKVRGYDKASFADVQGRYKRASTLWG